MNMLENLTESKKEALEELKRKVADHVPPHLKNDTFLYLRFLRARDFNINMAEDMLRNHLIWRKANNIDTILTDFTPNDVAPRKIKDLMTISLSEEKIARMAIVYEYLPLRRICFDKEGAPVCYIDFGNMDAKGILKAVKKADFIKAVLRSFEEDVVILKHQTEKLGRSIEQWTYIFNYENMTFAKATHKPTLEFLLALFMEYEANYPERLKAAYLINASFYFSLLFAVVKPMLSGATLKKITIFGKDGWQEELLNAIHADDLPAFLGGNRTDPDGNPLCRTIVKHGELVPEEYYLTKSSNRLSRQPGVKKVMVSRMSKVCIDLEVPDPGSLIEWEFETQGKDIGFGILYKSFEYDTIKQIVPNQRIDTHLMSETGMYQCEWPGLYILVFDNSYSWIRQKEIYYKVKVMKPKVSRTNCT